MTSDEALVDLGVMLVRSRGTLDRAWKQLSSSAQSIEASRRLHRRRALRGGSTDQNGSHEPEARLKQLITTLPKETPKIYAGKCIDGSKCDICGQHMLRGATEYEAVFKAISVRLDRNCFAMWQSEIAKN